MLRRDKVVGDESEMPVGAVGLGEYWIEVEMYDARSGDVLLSQDRRSLPDEQMRLRLPVKAD